ncbi:aminoacyl--tRNA ligase-related protein, partial [Pseudoalteromonas sp. S186]|uniref:aminoacyl--tRNA ligase-related protein n=1 Tax=Pseudoalteromonas sp. S186 TaxID=2066521 RepID=UPI001272A835
LHDCLHSAWQCGTEQLDLALPGRLCATYVAENNERRTPVMIHRSILGSIELFLVIFTEEYAGLFPTRHAPKQVEIMKITDKQAQNVQEIV